MLGGGCFCGAAINKGLIDRENVGHSFREGLEGGDFLKRLAERDAGLQV
jgi:hypothetical protein